MAKRAPARRSCPNCTFPDGGPEEWCEKHGPVKPPQDAPQREEERALVERPPEESAAVHVDPQLLPVAAYLAPAFARAGTFKMTKRQREIVTAAIDPSEITFKWSDKAKTRALAYASHTETRRRFLAAFAETGCSLVPLEPPQVRKEEGEDPLVVWHGALVIDGCYVDEAYGECAYREANKNMTYTQAVEGAKSDCWSRVGKTLGMFLELWDRKFTEPLEKAWLEEERKREEARPKCPECRGPIFKSRYHDGYYCNKNKGGCGWEGDVKEDAAAPAEPQGRKVEPPPARRTEPPPTPGKKKPTHDVTDRTLQELDLVLRMLRRYEIANDDAGTLSLVQRVEQWLRDRNTEEDYQKAIRRAQSEIEARKKLGQKPAAEDDDLPF